MNPVGARAAGKAPAAGVPVAPTLLIHGGAGTILRAHLTRKAETAYRDALAGALRAGQAVLMAGGPSLDAVMAAIRVLEDDPLFNAGHGSVLNHEGHVELDASIMDGATGRAGGVAGVRTVRNPIEAARAVMDRSPHVLLAGEGADRFAADQGLAIVDPAYFVTEHRRRQLDRARANDRIELDHDGRIALAGPAAPAPDTGRSDDRSDDRSDEGKFGTVGAVALDALGNLAAGTSTGGLTNKRWGRIGDSPLIGAGTYADNGTVAVSGTGTGEFFMRGLVAYDIAARVRYLGASLSDAVDQTVRCALDERQGQGGVIALNARGEIKFGFNTEGMYRGAILGSGEPMVSIYR